MSNGGDRYMEANRRSWDARTPTHFGSRFYDVDGFRAGASSLQSIEIEEVGDVDGKSLLHLQCHFGLDTMSWARLGARATGVDFSEEAVSLARSLSEELGIDADFVVSNVYDLPDVLDQRFDVVFTSYGALTWLPDLERWADVAAHFLEPGGFLYVVDSHPFGSVFYDEEDAVELRPFYPYSTRGARAHVVSELGVDLHGWARRGVRADVRVGPQRGEHTQRADLGRADRRVLPRVPLLRIPGPAHDGAGRRRLVAPAEGRGVGAVPVLAQGDEAGLGDLGPV